MNSLLTVVVHETSPPVVAFSKALEAPLLIRSVPVVVYLEAVNPVTVHLSGAEAEAQSRKQALGRILFVIIELTLKGVLA